MKKLHPKSPCCQGKIRTLGARRRQCLICQKTWTIKPRRRGPKSKRTNNLFIIRYFKNETPSIRGIARIKNCSREKVRRKFQISLNKYLKQNKLKLYEKIILENNSPLIAIADAMWQKINNQEYAVYIILLRFINSNTAFIARPVILAGRESKTGWYNALDMLGKSILKRIKALVTDGEPGPVGYAREHSWIIQRCLFHLMSSVQNYLSTSSRAKNRPLGEYVNYLVKEIIRTKNLKHLEKLKEKILEIIKTNRSRWLRGVLKGVLRNLNDFRAYILYPELNLPTTSNSVECLIGEIRSIMHQTRGFKNLNSFTKWLNAFLIFKKTITCNGKNVQK